MTWPEKPSVSWQEMIRTISSLVSAICLLTMTVAMISAGVYTVNVVSQLEKNPSEIGDIVQNSKEAIHSANLLLKSSQMNPLMEDFHNLIGVMSQLATSIDDMRVQQILSESVAWRNMSSQAMVKFAKTILEL